MIDDQYDMLSVEEVMDLLHLGKNTAYQLLKDREIKCFVIKGRYKVPRISVYEYIEQQRNQQPF